MSKAPIRHFSAPTPGMPPRFERLRFMSAPAGGDGTAGVADGGQQAQQQTGEATGAAATQTAAATQAAQQQTATATSQTAQGGESLPDDPAALKALIADLRKENGAARTNAKQQAADEARRALAQDIGKALGLVQDNTPPDPAALTAAAEQAQQAARQAQVELAVYRAAGTHQGNPAALLDSRSFLAKVADLDPATAEFQTQVSEAIKAAVTDNPNLRAVQATGSSSVDHAGGSGEGRVRTPKPLTDAVATRLGTR